MNTNIYISIILVFLASNLIGQENLDTITAKEVIETYLEAIGGEDRINQIRSLEVRSTQTIGGDEHKLISSLIRGKSYHLERIFEGKKMIGIVNNKEGVNITDQGYFAMPEDQVARYQEDIKVVPELDYLNDNYFIQYNGIYELDGEIKCHEIGIRLPDSSMVYREYNMETGLLQAIFKRKEKIKIIDYREVGGVLFPSEYLYNRTNVVVNKILVNKDYPPSKFRWNSEKAEELLGRWEAIISKNEIGQEQMSFIEFSSNRSGRNGMSIKEKGQIKDAEMLNMNIVGWEYEGQDVKLQYYDSKNRKLYMQYFIIKDRKKAKIIGYIVDPELHRKFGNEAEPIILEFNKVRR